MSDYIPDDLLSKVLEKLPVKSLIRFSSVCKSWHSIIRSPSFITQHLNRVNKSPDQILKNEKIFFTASVSSLNALDNSCHNHLKLDRSSRSALYSAHIVGSCSGLVCLSLVLKPAESERIIIWNPFIRKSVSILSPQRSVRVTITYEFFVHPTTHQFKVFDFPCRRSLNDPPRNVEVYRQHLGAWSAINSVVPYFAYLSRAAVNGAVHWLVTDRYDGHGHKSILLFNMDTEAFSEMTLPPSLVHKSVFSFQLIFSSESLVLCESCPQEFYQSSCSTIWVMKEYGVSESWTKLFSIELPVEWLARPLGLRMNGQLLLRSDEGNSLLCYDPVTSKTTTVAIEGALPLQADTYVESLLLLNVNGASENETFGEFQSYN